MQRGRAQSTGDHHSTAERDISAFQSHSETNERRIGQHGGMWFLLEEYHQSKASRRAARCGCV